MSSENTIEEKSVSIPVIATTIAPSCTIPEDVIKNGVKHHVLNGDLDIISCRAIRAALEFSHGLPSGGLLMFKKRIAKWVDEYFIERRAIDKQKEQGDGDAAPPFKKQRIMMQLYTPTLAPPIIRPALLPPPSGFIVPSAQEPKRKKGEKKAKGDKDKDKKKTKSTAKSKEKIKKMKMKMKKRDKIASSAIKAFNAKINIPTFALPPSLLPPPRVSPPLFNIPNPLFAAAELGQLLASPG